MHMVYCIYLNMSLKMLNKSKEIFSEVGDVSYIVCNMNNTELIHSCESCEIKAADVSDSPSSLSLQPSKASLQCNGVLCA